MAQLEGNNRRKSKYFSSKKSLRVDLTPMVDLGFLLITFFILTTALSEPAVTNLLMPKDNKKVTTAVKEHATLTLMLSRNNAVAYYEGSRPAQEFIKHCSFNDLRSVIQHKQQMVAKMLGDRKETVVIISPDESSTYKNFVDALDEIQINDLKHYYIVDGK